jgi:release factor glutamine methyltransferase
MLLCHVLGLDRPALAAHPDVPIPFPLAERLDGLLARREKGEPVAYLLGRKEFYGRSFEVCPATLVPRPETELLVDEALRLLPESATDIVDLGTGSGCLAVTLLLERPAWTGVALDISRDALNTAGRNAERLGAASRLAFVHADFTRPDFWRELPGEPRMVISNPPYVTEKEYETLEPAVRLYEPRQALVSGPDGLEHARAVVEAAGRALPGGGLLLMEHGSGQGEAARALCSPATWEKAATARDLAGRDRCLVARRRGGAG